MTFLNLAVELQLAIIHWIDFAVDIINLQQTNTYFYSLIEHSVAVWKYQVERQVVRNKLYAPTYNDLSTAADFKRAATSASRFISACQHNEREGFMAYDNVPIDFSQMHPGSTLPTRNTRIYLAPGGRFLFTFNCDDDECWLSLWDLDRTTCRLRHLILSSDERLPNAIYMGMVYTDKIQVIYEAQVDVDPITLSSATGGRTDYVDTTYHLIEIDFDVDTNTFSANECGRITVLQPDWPQYYHSATPSVHPTGHSLILQFSNTFTVVWDYTQNRASAWWIQNMRRQNSMPMIHIVGEYALYVLAQGIFGVELTPVTEISDGLVPLSFRMESKTIGDVFSFPHSPTLELFSGRDEAKVKVLCPTVALPVPEQSTTLLYEVMQITSSRTPKTQSPADTDDDTAMSWSPGGSEWGQDDPQTDNTDEEDVNAAVATIHRYRFRFNFQNPRESTLIHTQSTEGSIGPNNVFTDSYFTCEGRFAHFWGSVSWDGDTSLITLSPSDESIVNEVHAPYGSTGSVPISNLQVIPFLPSDIIREEIHRHGVCLPSGTVVLIWVSHTPTCRYWAKQYRFIQ